MGNPPKYIFCIVSLTDSLNAHTLTHRVFQEINRSLTYLSTSLYTTGLLQTTKPSLVL